VIRAQRDGDAVELAVIDKGGGVAESVQGAMLEPFVTTKREGLGMGLSIVRSIVEQHEGELRVENEPGRGVTVRVRLPAWKQGRD
jgi:two-component system sensor kinase FixL